MCAMGYHEIYNILEQTPVISTHEHHLEDSSQIELTLDGIIEQSYVGWQGISAGTTKSSRERFLEQVRYNSYFVWLQKGLARLYDFEGRITAEVWDDLSKQIKKRHSDPDAHAVILKEECRYLRGLSDIYIGTRDLTSDTQTSLHRLYERTCSRPAFILLSGTMTETPRGNFSRWRGSPSVSTSTLCLTFIVPWCRRAHARSSSPRHTRDPF